MNSTECAVPIVSSRGLGRASFEVQKRIWNPVNSSHTTYGDVALMSALGIWSETLVIFIFIDTSLYYP
jgi:hypothetical protein